MADKWAGIVATIFGVVLITTLVLPGRQTPAVIREGGGAFAKIINATLGRG
jgi:hypothetical protein